MKNYTLPVNIKLKKASFIYFISKFNSVSDSDFVDTRKVEKLSILSTNLNIIAM